MSDELEEDLNPGGAQGFWKVEPATYVYARNQRDLAYGHPKTEGGVYTESCLPPLEAIASPEDGWALMSLSGIERARTEVAPVLAQLEGAGLMVPLSQEDWFALREQIVEP